MKTVSVDSDKPQAPADRSVWSLSRKACKHVEIRCGFELCGVLSFLRKSLDSLPGLLSLFPLVANFPSPRSNSRLKVKSPRVNLWPWPAQTAGVGTGLLEKQFWSWGPGGSPSSVKEAW